jgi:hypothetical protein
MREWPRTHTLLAEEEINREKIREAFTMSVSLDGGLVLEIVLRVF